MHDVFLRLVTPDDAAALQSIYAPYVEETAVTFEYDVPSIAEFRARVEHTLAGYPYLAAVRDGQLLGYAYAGPLKNRAAYAWAAETSIYLRGEARRQGLGTRLYLALERLAQAQGLLGLYACVAVPRELADPYLSRDSLLFHSRMGYTPAGTLHRCGYKFGRWYDMCWLEKPLCPYPETPAPVTPFSALDPAARKRILSAL